MNPKKEVSIKVIEKRVTKALSVIGKDIWLPSNFVAKELLGVQHKSLLRKIRNELKKKENLVAQFRATKYVKKSTYSIKGEDETNYLMSEPFVMTIMMGYNNDTAVLYRDIITDIFYAMHKEIIRKQLTVELNSDNPAWIPFRITEKKARLGLTDAINSFLIPQRIKEGKQGDGWMYKNFTDVTYSILGLETSKCINTKDGLSPISLNRLTEIEEEVSKLIKKYALDGMNYKDVYKKIKKDLL